MLIGHARSTHIVYMPHLGRGKLQQNCTTSTKYNNSLDMLPCHYLLFMHEVNGCDTSSAPFGKGRKQALNIGLTSLRQIQTGNWTPITKEIFRYYYSSSHKCLLFTAFLQGIPIGTIMVGKRPQPNRLGLEVQQ